MSTSDIFRTMGRRAFGGGVVKRPAASVPDASPPPKKPVDPPNGLSQDQAAPATAPPPTPPAQKAPPPLFVDLTADWPTIAAKLRELTDGDVTALARGPHIRVRTSTVENFRRIQRHLHKEKVSFHTFTPRSRRPLKVVISGLPWTIEKEQLTGELDERFNIQEATRLRSRRGKSGRWLISLADDSEREDGHEKAAAIYLLRELFAVRVSVDAYRKPPGPPQCYNCQGFGHGSVNCGRPQRCVRCGEAHPVTRCPQPSSTKGKCCNCGGDHNANWRGCEAFQKAKVAAKPRPTQRRPDPRRPRRQPPKETRDTAPEPTNTEVVEQSSTEDEDGFRSTRKRRKRQPRNPENRRPRAEHHAQTSQEARASERTAPASQPRSTPRQRIDWPPKQPVTQQPAPTAEPAATKPMSDDELLGTLERIAAMLTELSQLIMSLMERRRQ